MDGGIPPSPTTYVVAASILILLCHMDSVHAHEVI